MGEDRNPRAVGIKISETVLTVELADGRTLLVPLAWFPRLLHGAPAERENWRLVEDGAGVHWPELDEDVSVSKLLSGVPSTESRASFERWLAGRSARAS